MTEEEAKTKWCPITRFHQGMDRDVYCNKPDGRAVSPDSSLCIGSDCMMWQCGNSGAKSLGQQQAEGVGIVEENPGYCGLTNR